MERITTVSRIGRAMFRFRAPPIRRVRSALAAASLAFVAGGCGGSSGDGVEAGPADASSGGSQAFIASTPNDDDATAADLGTVMEVLTAAPDYFVGDPSQARTVDTVSGAVTLLELPGGDVIPQPATGDTVLVAFSDGVSSDVHVLDRDLRERATVTIPTDVDFGRSFLSPDGRLLLDRRTNRDEVLVWTLDGEPFSRVVHPRSFSYPEAGWMHGNRIVLPYEDRRGFFVGPPGGAGTDFATLGLPPDVDGSIYDFDASPTSERIAFVLRERDGRGDIVNSIRVVDAAAGTVHTLVRTPGYPQPVGESFDPYDPDTDSHRIHNVFWHHEGRGLFVLVGASLVATLPPPLALDVIGWERSLTRLYFIESADVQGLTIDNADPANTSAGIAVVPRRADDPIAESWSLRADYFSFQRR